jgi:hypothetical protein
MGQQQTARFTATAGIVAILFYIVTVVLIADFPGVDSSATQLASYFAGHSTQMLLEGYCWGLVAAATLCFLTGLWAVFRRSENEGGVLATLGLGAGLTPALVLGYRAGSLAPSEVKLLADSLLLGTTLSALPTVVSVGAFSVLILRKGAAPRWIGLFGFLVIIAHLVDAGSFAQDGLFSPTGVPVYVAPILYYLWMLSLSVALLLTTRNKTAPVASAYVHSEAR